MKKKLLFIVPHLSTGGMPQFVLRQIEILGEEYDISLIEWENVTGGIYVLYLKSLDNQLQDCNNSASPSPQDLFLGYLLILV